MYDWDEGEIMPGINPEIRRRARRLRQPQTPAEQILWACLRNEQLGGYKIRRQHPIGFYITDFYCARVKLVIEIDGAYHMDRVEYDRRRTAWLENQGCIVMRFSNREVEENLSVVLDRILEKIKSLESVSMNECNAG